jgi:hypothetical protein
MKESREIRRSMNQKRSLIEAARLKKRAQADDQEILKQVDEIRSNILTLHKRTGSKKFNSSIYSSRVEGDYGAYDWTL